MTRTNEDKISIASQYIFSRWDKENQSCVYHDDSTDKDYVCDNKAEMIDLYNLINDEDPDIRRDAYSHWCSQTNHAEYNK